MRYVTLTVQEVGNWYASGRAGNFSAVATCMRCTAEDAVRLAIQAARKRYGITDWRNWSFTAEEFGFGRQRILHFAVDTAGAPMRIRHT